MAGISGPGLDAESIYRAAAEGDIVRVHRMMKSVDIDKLKLDTNRVWKILADSLKMERRVDNPKDNIQAHCYRINQIITDRMRQIDRRRILTHLPPNFGDVSTFDQNADQIDLYDRLQRFMANNKDKLGSLLDYTVEDEFSSAAIEILSAGAQPTDQHLIAATRGNNVRFGHEKLMKKILATGKETLSQGGLSRALLIAVQERANGIARLLLAAGAKPILPKHEQQPMKIAIETDNFELVEELVKAGARVTEADAEKLESKSRPDLAKLLRVKLRGASKKWEAGAPGLGLGGTEPGPGPEEGAGAG